MVRHISHSAVSLSLSFSLSPIPSLRHRASHWLRLGFTIYHDLACSREHGFLYENIISFWLCITEAYRLIWNLYIPCNRSVAMRKGKSPAWPRACPIAAALWYGGLPFSLVAATCTVMLYVPWTEKRERPRSNNHAEMNENLVKLKTDGRFFSSGHGKFFVFVHA